MCGTYLGIVGDEKKHTQGVSSQVAPGGGGKGENQKTPLPTHTRHSWTGRPWVSHYPLMGFIRQAKGTSRAFSLALKTRLRGSWGINTKNSRALRDGLLFLQWKPRKEGRWVCWWVFSLNLDQQSLAQITGWTSTPGPFKGHSCSCHTDGIISFGQHQVLQRPGVPAPCGWVPWIMRSSLSLLLSFPTRNSLLLSMSLCHISYYRLKALWQHPVCRVTSPLRILGIHCLAAFSGPLHGYIVWSPGLILE